MISRCRYCNEICPDFSEECDCCAYIEEVCKEVVPILKEFNKLDYTEFNKLLKKEKKNES
jgi:hypothetical protein